MQIKNKKLKKALESYKQISLLTKVIYLADWDMQTYMPPYGSKGRAQQVGYLTELLVDKWLDPEFKNVVSELEDKTLNETEQAMVRNLVQSGKIYFKVPKKLLVERARVTSEAVSVWQIARAKKKFSLFLPHLSRIIEIHQDIANYLTYPNHPYDALLDLYEPALTTARVTEIFAGLKEPLSSLHKKLREKSSKYHFKHYSFDQGKQKELNTFIMKQMKYDLKAGRLDESAHPFCTTLDRQDVRITTKYHLDDVRKSFQSVMHESGHALYEQGLPLEYDDTPLGQAASYGIHESQSRLWENQIGRNPHFLKYISPKLKTFFPDFFGQMNEHELQIYFNDIKISPIRIEADEVAYNLHIVLRFELERDIIAKKLAVRDLPEAWNALSKKLLNFTPKNDSEGVLQDIHWSGGNFGYFPTYALGNLYAAQIFNSLQKSLPLNIILEKGEFNRIVTWLRAKIHTYGSYYLPEDLIKRATGKSVDPAYFLKYLKEKYTSLGLL